MIPKLVMFDLDNTLAESKAPLTSEMAGLVAELLARTKVAVISGGALPQFVNQVVNRLPADAHKSNLYILPVSGAALYEFCDVPPPATAINCWGKIYEEHIPESDAAAIEAAIDAGVAESGVIDPAAQTYGPRTEYRGGEVTFSALGQQAPVEEKKAWDPDHAKRIALQAAIAKHLPAGYEARMGGATSIDINKEGVDKAYGIRQLAKRLGLAEKDMLYVGDELVANGNDETVFKTQAATKQVANPGETAAFIRELLAQ